MMLRWCGESINFIEEKDVSDLWLCFEEDFILCIWGVKYGKRGRKEKGKF